MTIDLWLALAIANFAASLAPGQNVALVGSAATRAGLRGGSAALAGILLAEIGWSVLALTLILGAHAMNPALFAALQGASVLSLVWIGCRILCERAEDAAEGPAGRPRMRRLVLRGIWIGAANPLALVFFLSVLPAFLAEGSDFSDPATLVFYVSAVLASSGAGLLPWLVASDRLARAGLAGALRIVSGGALLAIAASVLWGICT